MRYFAHSPKDGIPAQEYATHITAVRERAVKYAYSAGRYSLMDGDLLPNLVDMAATYHDLGKLDEENQAVLSGERLVRSLPKHHWDAGAAHFLHDDNLSPLAAVVVYAHHIGLNDFTEEGTRGEAAFRDVELMAETNKLLPMFEKIHNEIIPTSFSTEPGEPQNDLSVLLRIFLSCLADADHTDTAVNYGKYPAKEKEVQLKPKERLKLLNSYVETLGEKNEERSRLRREMYITCRDAIIEPNISSCDSPVGSGKTTAVMAHLLAQAAKRSLRRIFVVLPYTNIIKQSVEIYRKALVLPGENPEDVVAELHHRADFENEDVRYLTALWRAPIIVTTAVAFFETLAANTPATLRRLHELPGSAVFVDESHAALPAKLLPLAWKWIKIYANEWGCYWTLASGSLNRFWEIPEIAQSSGSVYVPEIVDDHLRERLFTYEKNRIVYRSDLHRKDINELIDWISSFPGPRLVIFNTVQSAAVIADAFEKRYGREYVEHLSTALTPIDREKALERVRKRLANPDDADWTFIATSCVEAGVDLSFRTGFRELGSLVSLLQASGRINREGLIPGAEMWTFRLVPGYMLKKNPGMKDSAEILHGYIEDNREISPMLSTQSIADEICLSGVSSKYKGLLKHESFRNFRSVAEGFQVIDSDTKIVLVSEEIAHRLEHGKFNWRELQKNSVQIAHYKLKELRTQEVLPGIYKWNLDYNDFLGYTAGIIQLKKFDNQVLII